VSLQKPLRKEQRIMVMVQELLNPLLHPHKKKWKFGKTILSEGECLSQALNFMRRVADDYDTFGEYVAMELRS